MNADVLKEFLVKLAYQVDASSERKFQQGLKGATSAAVEMGKAVVALSIAVQAAAVKIGDSLDQLYFQSQRTQASAKSIREVGYAVSQLGGSYREALGSIEAFSAKMRQNPGYESMVKQLGVVTRENGKLRDTAAIMQDIGKVLGKKNYAVAFAYANALGIDENTFKAMMSGEWQKRVEETRKKMANMGVDVDAAAKSGNRFMDAWRGVQDTLGGIGDKLATNLLPNLTAFMLKVDDYLQKNSDQIVNAFTKLGEVVVELGKALGKVIEHIEPLWTWFDKTSKSLLGQNGLTTAIEILIGLKVAKWLMGIAAALGAVNAAAMGGGAGLLGKILAAGRIGMLGSAGALAFGSYRSAEDRAGDKGAIERWQRKNAEAPGDEKGFLGSIKKGWRKAKKALGFGGDEKTADAKPGDLGGKTFSEKAPKIMRQLMKDFDLTKEQAAGILGNLGHESGGLKDMQEKNPLIPGSRGGFGWAQWTGPRRRQFEAWSASRGLDPSSDEANYGFLRHELQTTHKGALADVKRAQTPDEAMMAFENQFERAGIKHYGSRRKWTQRALRAAEAQKMSADRDGFKLPEMPKLSQAQSALLGSLNKGAITQPAVPLAPSSNDNTLTLNQQTTINVQGATDPAGVASAVEGGQKSVNQGLMRNAQGALR